MLLHDSRRNARVLNGELITLEDQDRKLWDRVAIAEGLALVEHALKARPRGSVSVSVKGHCRLLHAEAGASTETDWPQIAGLYGKLLELNPSPVIALNEAVAIAMSGEMEAGLACGWTNSGYPVRSISITCFTPRAPICCGG